MISIILLVLLLGGAVWPLQAASLDYTASVNYQSSLYPFAGGDVGRGFVKLDGGFSVPASGEITLNLFFPVAGTINLNNTGAIALAGDLMLASGARFSSGGTIDGQNHSIILNSDLVIPAGKILYITGNTTIDGQGHALIFNNGNPGGSLIVAGGSGTKLILKNITIEGLKSYSDGSHALGFDGATSQTIEFDDAMIHMSGDFIFTGGALSIRHDVKMYGLFLQEYWPERQPTLFQYLSASHCTVQKNSMLSIDMTVGFIYMPVDESSKHFIFKDRSSRIFLNGSTLYVPQSIGLVLTKGHMLVDHRSFLQSDGRVDNGQSIQFGTGQVQNDMALDIFPGAACEIEDASVVYKNKN